MVMSVQQNSILPWMVAIYENLTMSQHHMRRICPCSGHGHQRIFRFKIRRCNHHKNQWISTPNKKWYFRICRSHWIPDKEGHSKLHGVLSRQDRRSPLPMKTHPSCPWSSSRKRKRSISWSLKGHDLPVYLNIDSLVQKHICILAKTGGGKATLRSSDWRALEEKRSRWLLSIPMESISPLATKQG